MALNATVPGRVAQGQPAKHKSEMKAIEKLARLPCKTCGGDGHVHIREATGSRYVSKRCKCPDCKSTGLLIPQLTKPCHACGQISVGHCPICGDSGRILESQPEMLWALLEWLKEKPCVVEFTWDAFPPYKHAVRLGLVECDGATAWARFHMGDTPLDALAAAILDAEGERCPGS